MNAERDWAKCEVDLEAIRERLSMAELCARDGVEMKKSGTWLVGLCPFHEERTPSFQIGSRRPDRAKCRGCGWSGGIFDFWMTRHGVTFREAIEQLASLVGLRATIPGVRWSRPARKVTAVTRAAEEMIKPPLPRLRALLEDEIAQLATLRGLSVSGVRAAAADRRVGFCVWPQFQHGHAWRAPADATGCWVVTDGERRVAQFRRLDGQGFRRKDPAAEPIKAWTKGSPSWPIGAAEIGARRRVLLVEGGADMLAGYHFLSGLDLLGSVSVVCMLGGGNRINEAALAYFRGARVRIMMDADPERVMRTSRSIKLIRPGTEAAARWTEQLTKAGAVVETFSLYGLQTAAGQPVKDLNDLALCAAEVVSSDEILEAFFEWDF